MRTTWLTAGLASALFLLGADALASADAPICAGTPHVRQVVTVDHPARCVATKLYEGQDFCLMDADGNELSGTTFDVTPGAAFGFGMRFDQAADFNMEYALTCVLQDGANAKSPKVIVTVGANGPGQPSLSVVNLYGAQGAWRSNGDEIDIDIKL